MKKRLLPIPAFISESEERVFWEDQRNDTTRYLAWSKAKLVHFPNLQPSTAKPKEHTSRTSK